jgi:hypothetical protein
MTEPYPDKVWAPAEHFCADAWPDVAPATGANDAKVTMAAIPVSDATLMTIHRGECLRNP